MSEKEALQQMLDALEPDEHMDHHDAVDMLRASKRYREVLKQDLDKLTSELAEAKTAIDSLRQHGYTQEERCDAAWSALGISDLAVRDKTDLATEIGKLKEQLSAALEYQKRCDAAELRADKAAHDAEGLRLDWRRMGQELGKACDESRKHQREACSAWNRFYATQKWAARWKALAKLQHKLGWPKRLAALDQLISLLERVAEAERLCERAWAGDYLLEGSIWASAWAAHRARWAGEEDELCGEE